MFKKILVANRGEIALRVMRTCREMGIKTVAVYSEADRNALHVRYADEAYLIGAGPPRESYLNQKKILQVARKAKAEAIHPGYGFLSENPAFAAACDKAGIVFIGPSPQTVGLLGDKVAARKTVMGAGVPVVPGTEGVVRLDEAPSVAARVGYPVLIKAAAGGGGKGIRIVQTPEELDGALRVAASEAKAAFGDEGVYIEKFLRRVRHVEIQVMGDRYGNVVALGERECSIQRRHQKLIEESPSVAVDEPLRGRMQAAAVAAAKASGYYNAGTVEFLLDPEGNFYFLEVNTRLQVEHPVTEWLTGRDLVADQIRVAAGEPLGYTQADVVRRGHAIEARITAEDPWNSFLPSLGVVEYVSEPSGPGVRVDSAIYSGGEVSYFYDPMLAKVITWGEHRQQAIDRLKRALREYIIVGVQTNIPFHLQLLEDERFLRGEIHTAFLDEEFQMAPLTNHDGTEDVALMVSAILTHLKKRQPTVEYGPTAAEGSNWRAAGRSMQMQGLALRGRGWLRSTV